MTSLIKKLFVCFVAVLHLVTVFGRLRIPAGRGAWVVAGRGAQCLPGHGVVLFASKERWYGRGQNPALYQLLVQQLPSACNPLGL